MLGHAVGTHAPGRELGFGALAVGHHLLLGHGLAVAALRAAGATNIGIASNHGPIWAATDSAEDAEARDLYDTLVNRTFADPVLLGRYPDVVAGLMPGPVDDDLRVISAPLDWFGVNYYRPTLVAAPGTGAADAPELDDDVVLPPDLPFELRRITGVPTSDFGWPVVPDGLREILTTFRQRYGDRLPPVYVTESGCSYHDEVGPDGAVHDQARIDYHDAHLRAVAAAVDQGVDVRGYFVWSLLDNFEWAAGFDERFGLVHVDYATQARTPKDSYRWYQQLLAARHGR
jgi:beta-glucosidase